MRKECLPKGHVRVMEDVQVAFVDSRRRPSLSTTWFRPYASRGVMCLYDTMAIVCATFAYCLLL